MMISLTTSPALSKRTVAFSPMQRGTLVIQNAHKKGAGSTKNGRDSNSQSRGVKVFGGQPVKAGGIIVRQVGTTWHDGTNTSLGKDYTLFSLVDGIVMYDKKKQRPSVHVYPYEHAKAVAAVEITHTKKPKEGVPSRKERRKTMYTPRGAAKEASALSVATIAATVRP
ncbi:hypothetical protein CEUSTIGMA_g13295.t1 [Chlamydomonas eustigma]|uniref:50S ribosomal protein L27, chloroplastic n=1 Tax=Chlamydomonas eustigma TaxID=1157962 RepID=A0A250XSE8_9CHLO|nr:hypothetical protein CEUSTIGMA_g13295.t1 [Chlamydomonas eustigma]|eukprot:GAX85879.1 hypothetical protein CEUSTIGMA_g13295.t1 [Chlamydomonas eustigma]